MDNSCRFDQSVRSKYPNNQSGKTSNNRLEERKSSKDQLNCGKYSRVTCYNTNQSQEDCKQLRHNNKQLRHNAMTSHNDGDGRLLWGPMLMVVLIATTLPHFVSGSSRTNLVSSRICQGVSGLTPLQKSMCSSNPPVFVSMATAIVRASKECQWHFRWKRWNCYHGNNTKKLFFPQELSIPTKELAYDHAVKSAELFSTIFRECAKGSMGSKLFCISYSFKHLLLF